jgi:hypothetical protein
MATIWYLENGLDNWAKPETKKRILSGFRSAGFGFEEKEVFPDEK